MDKGPYDLQEGETYLRVVQEFSCPLAALDYLKKLYSHSVQSIQKAFRLVQEGNREVSSPPEGHYPYIGVYIQPEDLKPDPTQSYGIFDTPGFYGTTITQLEFFEAYYLEQLTLLIQRYNKPVQVGLSDWPIPLSFVVDYSASSLSSESIDYLKLKFELPKLTRITDEIVNHTYKPAPKDPKPLALFSGERVDFSLHRLHHYTGTSPEHFQNFILLTNYQRYVEAFAHYSLEQLQNQSEYEAFVEPGDIITLPGQAPKKGPQVDMKNPSLPQMPAYHLKRADRNGITFINIGVGPTNAKNITDHLAVLRPHCWIMLGHCAGLKRSQNLGDYVLAHGYVRDDGVLDYDLPLWVPIPPLAEVQIALQEAFSAVTGLHGLEAKTRMRTGTVYTTDNRNWELRAQEIYERFNQSRAMALDMESATIAANGLRFRVPYGTLLCVSDKPIHGDIKLRGMANTFYNDRVNQHLYIGLRAIQIIQRQGIESLHSRKLRGFDEPAFR